MADALGQQAELDEGDNTVASDEIAVTAFQADLTITIPTVPTTATAGRALAITTLTRNVGPAPAGVYAIRFYLSADDLLDAGDTLLGTRSVGGLAAGSARTDITSVTIPAGTAAGSYFVLAVVDALGQVPELDEGNNLGVSAPLSVAAAP